MTVRGLIFALFLPSSQSYSAPDGRKLPSEFANFQRKLVYSRHDAGNATDRGHKVQQQEYFEGPQGFSGGRIIHRTDYGSKSCETLLSEQQAYAIGKMSGTGYLAESAAEFYQSLGSDIAPEQVAFFETFRIVPQGTSLLKEAQDRHFTDDNDIQPKEFQSVRTASLWSVSGQKLLEDRLAFQMLPLPWQLEDEWKEVSSQLDRGKYPFVWEWGRAAQDLSGDIEPLYRANALANLKETLASNVDLDSAFVMFHSLSKVNTRLYDRGFPNSRFAAKGEDNVLFLVPLRKVLERYAPSSISPQIAAMKNLAPQISEVDLVQLLDEHRSLFWDELDFFDDQGLSSTPIVALDWSDPVKAHSLLGLLKKLGLSEENERIKFANHMIRNIEQSNHSTNLGQYVDVIDVATSIALLDQKNTYQLSNISKSVSENPKKIIRTLFGAYYYKLHQALQAAPQQDEETQVQAHHGLVELDYKFAISTWDEEFAKRLESLGGKLEFSQLDRPNFKESKEEEDGAYWITRSHFRPLFTVSFDLKTLSKLAKTYPEIEKNAAGSVNRGRHHTSYKLRAMELL